MSSRYFDTIRTHCQPVAPEPTNTQPRLGLLPGIRAVLFDIYGTLLTSRSGDIGTDQGVDRVEALTEVLSQYPFACEEDAQAVLHAFEQTIREHHAAARQQGVAHPEVVISQVWRETLQRCTAEPPQNIDFDAFALEFEVRVNPTWPMPGVLDTLSWLREAGLVLGIVSNAQFFTPVLFPALLGQSLEELGFNRNLAYFSYEHGQAKPGTYLYELARDQLASKRVQAHEVLYVGNDMLNDVTAAASVGFRTALFAGDQRSLRLRADDDRVADVKPNVVVTELPQLLDCLPKSTADPLP